MKITSLLSKLILEQSRFQVLYDKMVKPSAKSIEKDKRAKGLMDFDTLKTIIFADPTTKAPENFDIEGASAEDMDKVKVGKYSQWLLKNFISPKQNELELPADFDYQTNQREFKNAMVEFRRLFMEDLYKTTDDLKKVWKGKTIFTTRPKRYQQIHTKNFIWHS